MATSIQETRWKEEFENRIIAISKHEKKEDHLYIMTKKTYDSLVDEVEEAQSTITKTSKQYRRLRRFQVINIDGKRKLATSKEPIKYYLSVDEIFDKIKAAHEASGHGGRDKLKHEISQTSYANITLEMISIFLSMCETCQHKKISKKKDIILKSKINSAMNSRCQVKLIDMQTREDCGFKFIMVYQDLWTKFVVLRALQSKKAKEVANQLTDIFLTFGAPCIIHSDNGREFVDSVINEVTLLWAECKLVYGKQRDIQSQGSVERDIQDVETLLFSWMQDNNTTNWSNGLRFIQFMKNQAFHPSIKQSPFKAMFGMEPRVGLMTSTLPPDTIKDIRDEDDLEEALNKINVTDTENVKHEPPEMITAERDIDPEYSSETYHRELPIKAEPFQYDPEAVDSTSEDPLTFQRNEGLEAVANVNPQIKMEITDTEIAYNNSEKQAKKRKL